MTLNINTSVADRAAIESTDRGVRSEVGSGKSEVGNRKSEVKSRKTLLGFRSLGFPRNAFFF